MIVIDAASAVPPFEQLRAQLARMIQDGTLAVGARLPTIRRLAADLGLAANTVGRAYRELEEAGLIETRRAAGSYVSAAGGSGREEARRAAGEYAALVARAGIGHDEALRIVRAALNRDAAPPSLTEARGAAPAPPAEEGDAPPDARAAVPAGEREGDTRPQRVTGPPRRR